MHRGRPDLGRNVTRRPSMDVHSAVAASASAVHGAMAAEASGNPAWLQQEQLQGGFGAAAGSVPGMPSVGGGGMLMGAGAAAATDAKPSPRGEGGDGDGELTLLAKSQVQKIAVNTIMQTTGFPRVSISADAADAMQKATTIFACYLASSAHEVMLLRQEDLEQAPAAKRRKVPLSKKPIDPGSVLLATDLVAPAIAQQLRHWEQHFDVDAAKALQAQEKAERAKEQEQKLERTRQIQEQQMHQQAQAQDQSVSRTSSYEQQHLQQQMQVLMQQQQRRQRQQQQQQ